MIKLASSVPVSLDQQSEEWRPIPGFEGYYEASNLGRVRGIDRTVPNGKGGTRIVRGRILKQRTIENGYSIVMMSMNGKYQNRLVHRLVLKAFRGVPADGIECCHTNGIRSDNRLTNLRWDTKSANSVDQVNHGTHRNVRKTHCERGHEFTPGNTYVRPGGQRNCRACKRDYDRANWRKYQKKPA